LFEDKAYRVNLANILLNNWQIEQNKTEVLKVKFIVFQRFYESLENFNTKE